MTLDEISAHVAKEYAKNLDDYVKLCLRCVLPKEEFEILESMITSLEEKKTIIDLYNIHWIVEHNNINIQYLVCQNQLIGKVNTEIIWKTL